MNQSEIREVKENQASETQRQQPKVKTYDRWQLFFLDRLHRLCLLREQIDSGNIEDYKVSALKRAIFSTLLDCDAAGVGEEARQMLYGPSYKSSKPQQQSE
ncbi:hypothetical protein Tter_0656 [Thermobaculum terrenum ATCC BAA-798]|uniref:Uncharacterized protein n=1 Tax=Thermobaculum terrenum (strain ATCC BAA-798 / CCMEE 7001 / YNP1) TaxID=525904 RepID=D1CF67_THET1|nr:hypothetical protein [Thermobaculum terrenum]ACZ41573.1 hypothetical protein Tter_0656 [Thermobaculum terrenum ATCC BAA-798]